ncbi:TetR/AcrR family transcriptional regulator, partial [Nocardioides sp. CER28]
EAHELMGLPRRPDSSDEVAGLLFIGGMAELIAAWLDGVIDATADDIVEAASRSFLGLYA